LFTDDEIFTVVTPKYPKNHQLYENAAIKKHVATKRLSTRSTFRQSLTDGD